MKKVLSLLLIAVIGLGSFGFTLLGENPTKKSVDERVKELIAQMTLEEKVGQMNQITIQVISAKPGNATQKHELDFAKLDEAINTYHVGSILNTYDMAHELPYWQFVIKEIQDRALKTRLKIPVFYGIDAIHGATYTLGSTLFPQAISMGATFNRALEYKAGEITSIETKASGIPWNFYPVLDVGRQPVWPRLWETFGEDPFLVSEMGVAYIKGAQGDDYGSKTKLATCLKHYVGYSMPFNGKDRTPAYFSDRFLRETLLPPFKAAIDAGAMSVMVNSAEIDGIPTHSDYHILTEILRGELKFKGLVVSDWEDIKRLYDRDHVADSPKEAVRMAVMAGVDMSMVPQDYTFYKLLIELVKEGKVPMSRIDEAVSRILKVKLESGVFEHPYADESLKSQFATKEHTAANLAAASESIILAKNNNNTLPLAKNKKVLVTGPTANMLSVLNGGWTITWQGNVESLYPQEKNTILEAIKNKIGDKNVVYSKGCDFDKDINTKETANMAKDVDAVILCLGEHAYCETPGNILDLKLEDAQLNLAKEVAKAGKPVILIMNEGRPRIISSIVDLTSAVLVGFLPGMEGGNATADILFGDVSPSGRMPITYPINVNGHTTYDHKWIEGHPDNTPQVQWWFGHGLSYTTFSYSDLKLSSNTLSKDGIITASVTVKNTGKVAAKEAVLMYISDMYASVSRPVKQLKGFDKIELAPGESQVVSFVIKEDMLTLINREMKKVVESGDFTITIGGLQAGFIYK